MFNLFELFIVYFMFGCLEVYYALSDIWAVGLVLENYNGIIDMICLPLLPNAEGRPLTFKELSSKPETKTPLKITSH